MEDVWYEVWLEWGRGQKWKQGDTNQHGKFQGKKSIIESNIMLSELGRDKCIR